MPKYSITAKIRRRSSGSTQWVEAATREEAIVKSQWVPQAITRVVLLEDHSEWREIWWKALNNMPSMVHHNPREKWVEVPHNTTPIGTFIKRQAKGTMRREGSGIIYRRVVTRQTVRNYQLGALTSLLGYALSGQGTKLFFGRHDARQRHVQLYSSVTNGLAFGTKPKGERAELLKKLAGPDGAALAIELLNK